MIEERQKIRNGRPTVLALLASLALVWPAAKAGRASAQGTRTVTDEAGRQVKVPVQVNRVVSLAPNVTDILYDVGAGEKIVAITDFTDLPPGASPKPSVGEPLEPSLERIVAARPDLVFVAQSANRLETMDSLDRLGIPVYATETRTVMGMLSTVRDVAEVVGAGPAGQELATELEARLDAVQARLMGRKPKRVLFVVWQDPLITTGRNTFIADALRWAGAESVVSTGQDWPHLGLEEVVHLQPDALIFPDAHSSAAQLDRSLATQPGWRDLQAVRQGKVLVVSDAIDRPSPALVGAIENLARALHPAAFAGNDAAPSEVKPRPGRRPMVKAPGRARTSSRMVALKTEKRRSPREGRRG